MLHAVHSVGKLTLEVRVVPFMIQILRSPVALFCQRMSALPSPLKSPEPAMLHAVHSVGKLTLEVRVVPFMIQILRSPVTLFCQRMSALPSPLKSDRLDPPPTIVAPRNASTWPIGFAIAVVLLPAKSNPTARGFVAASSTISDPESPLSKNLLPLLAITIWPVKVLVK